MEEPRDRLLPPPFAEEPAVLEDPADECDMEIPSVGADLDGCQDVDGPASKFDPVAVFPEETGVRGIGLVRFVDVLFSRLEASFSDFVAALPAPRVGDDAACGIALPFVRALRPDVASEVPGVRPDLAFLGRPEIRRAETSGCFRLSLGSPVEWVYCILSYYCR